MARKDFAEKHPDVVAKFAKVTLDSLLTMRRIRTPGRLTRSRYRKRQLTGANAADVPELLAGSAFPDAQAQQTTACWTAARRKRLGNGEVFEGAGQGRNGTAGLFTLRKREVCAVTLTNVGAAEGCDLLISRNKIKNVRSPRAFGSSYTGPIQPPQGLFLRGTFRRSSNYVDSCTATPEPLADARHCSVRNHARGTSARSAW